MKISDKYIDIWIEQAEREKTRNPGDSVSVDLDSWLSMLHELRTYRATNRRKS
jgi:hypothetical protein